MIYFVLKNELSILFLQLLLKSLSNSQISGLLSRTEQQEAEQMQKRHKKHWLDKPE